MPKKIIALFMFSLLLITSCDKKSKNNKGLLALLLLQGSAGSTLKLGGTKAPGDVLTGTIDSRSYQFTNETTVQSISGDVITYASGFKALWNQAAGMGPFAIVIPGVGMISGPFSADGGSSLRAETYVDISGADCTAVNGTYNIVQSAFDTTGNNAFYSGSIVISGTDKVFIDSGGSQLLNIGTGGMATLTLTLGTCSAGRVTYSPDTVFIGSSGAIIIDRGTGNGGLIGFKADTSINSTSSFNGKTFGGFDNIKAMGTSADNFTCYKMTCTGTSCTAANTDARTGGSTPIPGSMTLNFTSALNGLIQGTVGGITGGMPHAMNDKFVIAAYTYKGKMSFAVVFAGMTGNPISTGLFTELP